VCETGITPDQGITSGSQSHPAEFGPNGLRQALATAREALFEMAATRFGVSVDQLTVADGVISVASDPSQSVSYGQLIGDQRFSLAVNPQARPKDPTQYTVLGRSLPRYEIPAKVTGEFQYGQHVRLPVMLHGKVGRPPNMGAEVVSINESVLAGMPGNVVVVRRNNFVGVVADKEIRALRAATRLASMGMVWTPGVTLPPQQELYDYMRQQPSRDSYTVLTANTLDPLFDRAASVLRATYLYPYQMHGSVGTSC